jgi:hypothetical protein
MVIINCDSTEDDAHGVATAAFDEAASTWRGVSWQNGGRSLVPWQNGSLAYFFLPRFFYEQGPRAARIRGAPLPHSH